MIKCLLRLNIDNLKAWCGLHAAYSELIEGNDLYDCISVKEFIQFHTQNRVDYLTLLFYGATFYKLLSEGSLWVIWIKALKQA